MKYYSENVKDIEIWNESDRISYINEIQKVIDQYLPKTEFEEHE
ncbi:hypothetical protein [Riemerella anatipestifer]|nr:hypothetical protein [Riemerella anatipestifer]MCQ4181991.1 hypothetical protein [Riemerella anatipestifer]MDR7694931.1 hypothetical protein [Riemerella anatipestifer]MDR7784848.1 hypothetical protein [Riemerella anatipestifer]